MGAFQSLKDSLVVNDSKVWTTTSSGRWHCWLRKTFSAEQSQTFAVWSFSKVGLLAPSLPVDAVKDEMASRYHASLSLTKCSQFSPLVSFFVSHLVCTSNLSLWYLVITAGAHHFSVHSCWCRLFGFTSGELSFPTYNHFESISSSHVPGKM